MRLAMVLAAAGFVLIAPARAAAAPVHYAGVETGALGSPLVFTVDGSKVSGLVYYGVFECPGFEQVYVGLPGYRLPDSGTRQGDTIDLAYTSDRGTLELKGTVSGNTASGTIGGTLNGCNLGQRPWRAIAFGGAAASRHKAKPPKSGRWVGTDSSGHAAVAFQVKRRSISGAQVVEALDCKRGAPIPLASFRMKGGLSMKVSGGRFDGGFIPGSNFQVIGIYNFTFTVNGKIAGSRAKGKGTLALGPPGAAPDCYGRLSFTAMPLPG